MRARALAALASVAAALAPSVSAAPSALAAAASRFDSVCRHIIATAHKASALARANASLESNTEKKDSPRLRQFVAGTSRFASHLEDRIMRRLAMATVFVALAGFAGTAVADDKPNPTGAWKW